MISEVINLINSWFNLVKGKSPLLLIVFLYLIGLLLTRILPETLAFFTVGYFSIAYYLPITTIMEFAAYFIYLPLVIFAFYTGSLFPWHTARLFRKKLYKTTTLSFIFIVGFYVMLFYLIQNFDIGIFEKLQQEKFFFIFMFSSLMISGLKMATVIKKNHVNGPLASVVKCAADLINVLVLLIIAWYFGFVLLPQQNLLFYFFKPLVFAMLIVLIMMIAGFLTRIRSNSTTYKLLLFALILGFCKYGEMSLILLPLFAGILFSFYSRGEAADLFSEELLAVIKNLLIIFTASLVIVNSQILIIALVYYLLRNVLFRLFFYFFGKLFNFSETVFKNLGKALLIQGIFPVLFLFMLKNTGVISLADLRLWLSVIMLVLLLEDSLASITLKNTLKKAGEIISHE